MPAQPADQFSAVYNYLRRRHYNATTETWDVAGLQKIADDAFAAGTRTVTITSSSSDAGGAASGEMSFDKLTLLNAVNALLAEADPDNTPPAVSQTVARYR